MALRLAGACVVLVFLLVLGALALAALAPNRTGEMTALFAKVHRYPGAIAISSLHEARRIEESYTVAAAADAIRAHYERELAADGWTLQSRVLEDGVETRCYRQGTFRGVLTIRDVPSPGSWMYGFALVTDSECAR